ncbi:MAG: hypothetical protein M3P52_03345, partial [Actinomycetota bacterium]|nr:hypothetical protein [Actinomycetota bacterium]
AVVDGLPTNYWYTGRVDVDYTTSIAKHTFEPAKATIIGGKIGVPVAITPPREFYIDKQASYQPGATPTDPWQQKAHSPDSRLTTVLRRDEIPMFQDVIDQALRSQKPMWVVDETRNDVAVTTYAYSFAFGDFYESAPRLFESVSVIDGNAPDDARVTVTISLDEQWLVRYLDVNLDFEAVLKHRASNDPEVQYPYRYTLEITSITESPAAISIPTNTVVAPVDAPTTTVAP